jgi:hypothetical protein
MAHDGSPIPAADMIRRYQQELLELQKKSVPVVSVSQTKSALDEEFPAPDIEKDLAALQQSTENEAEPAAPQEGVPPFPVSPPTAEMPPAAVPKRDMSMGYLRVYASTGNGVLPVRGARVMIAGQGEDGTESLMQTRFTDESGYTPLFSLPAVNGSYSMSPDNKAPYTYYTVYVYADGFYPVKLSCVPIYGGSTSVQPVDLIPVAEGDVPTQRQTIIEGAPQNLQ